MTNYAQRLREDRAIRDASLALLKADVSHLRNNLTGKSFGERFVDRVSEGAIDVFEEAVEVADNHKGVLATLIAAVFIWFARNPILSLFSDEDAADDEGEQDHAR